MHTSLRPRSRAVAALVAATALVALTALAPSAAAATSPQAAPASRAAAAPPVAVPGPARAGAAVVDASWHVGAAQGQYAEDRDPTSEDAVDPYGHSTRRAPSTGLQSRISVRALLVEGGNGARTAVVANDLYLPQDLLVRRTAQLLAERDAAVPAAQRTGITADSLAITSSHSHGSPYYSTPSAGLFVFQDVVDLRFFEYMATQMAAAVVQANQRMVPTRMGGTVLTSNDITSHSYGPQVAEDGTPAGQPWDFTTQTASVLRFDDLSDPAAPKPLATWLVFGLHPEWSFGDGLVTGEINHAVMRMLDRELGGVTLMSQNETGTSGPHKDTRAHTPEERREFQDMKFSAMDRAARLLADTVKTGYDDIAAGTPEPGRSSATGHFAAFSSDFAVASAAQRFAPPSTRPYPGVSNCNTERAYDLDPGVPVIGFPDCEFVLDGAADPVDGQLPPDFFEGIRDELKRRGVPVPDSYAAPALGAVQETAAIRMQVIKLGRVAVTLCPCEQFTDQSRNIITRLDTTPGNLWLGFDWTPACVRTGAGPTGDWTCPHPRAAAGTAGLVISDLDYRRVRAQINNDARGWETDVASGGGESESPDPAQILGNFTHEELTGQAYDLVLTVGMANDYWGYSPSYREYRQGDYYRKALEAAGPHASDFFATRLTRMAASLQGAPPVAPTVLDTAFAAESARAEVLARDLGETARTYTATYEAELPAEGPAPAILQQPADIRRFDASFLRFRGGSNYTDLPDARVERLVGGAWTPYGDTTGEVQLQVRFTTPADLPSWRAGTFPWEWTAGFEAFTSELSDLGDRPAQTPAGTYRFVVDGTQRRGTPAVAVPYHLESQPFTVAPWDGITVQELQVLPSGEVSFQVGPTSTHRFGTQTDYVVGPIDYPDSYDSPFSFIKDERRLYRYGLTDVSRHQQYCPTCTFRPWADTADVAVALVTVEGPGCTVRTVPAVRRGTGTSARWVAPAGLVAGESAFVLAGGVVDGYGERNPSAAGIGGAQPACAAAVGPTPVVPEAPAAVLLASTGLVALAWGVALGRRRRSAAPS